MFTAPEHDTLVPFGQPVSLETFPTEIEDRPSEGKLDKRLDDLADELDELQRQLYADDRWSLLAIFQGRDAAGKDGTIRNVFRRTDPAGVQVRAFREPSTEELEHDFLWRTTRHLPERGHIGVFNRSYYEEVLIARVHPEFIEAQRLPDGDSILNGEASQFWNERFESIRDHELHLARNGMAIVKFFLHVSAEEQRQRFLARLDEPEKHWKFREADVRARDSWDDYTKAYEAAIGETSRSWAPWYIIPADDKDHMRVMVGQVLAAALRSLDLRPPEPSFQRPIEEIRAMLEKG